MRRDEGPVLPGVQVSGENALLPSFADEGSCGMVIFKAESKSDEVIDTCRRNARRPPVVNNHDQIHRSGILKKKSARRTSYSRV